MYIYKDLLRGEHEDRIIPYINDYKDSRISPFRKVEDSRLVGGGLRGIFNSTIQL